ncbi:MAG TPA: sugar transferase [Janthinobacterium sp.]|nr:sugar transferase [Janthinobacterium sp.]
MRDLIFLVHRIPYPPNKGDKIRSYHMLKYLSARYRVHLGCFIDDPRDRAHLPHLEQLCASTCFVEQHPFAARLRSLGGLLAGQALSVHYYRDAGLSRWVERLLAGAPLAAALAFSGPMAQYLQSPAARGVRRIIDFVDVDSDKWAQYGAAKDWPLSLLYRREARHLLAYESAVAREFDGASFVSRAEAELFGLRAPQAREHIAYFSNGVDADYFTPHLEYANPYAGADPVLVFTGAMDYWPNVEAVQWFVWRVWPALRRRYPALRFYIVGARPAPAVKALARAPGVCVTGVVPDVRPYLAHARLAVAPLRTARGVQNKVLEAMAMQKTVLLSPQALEGISALPGAELALAGDEAGFIAAAAALLDGADDAAMGLAARRRILLDYCWERNLERLGAMLAPDARALRAPGETAA